MLRGLLLGCIAALWFTDATAQPYEGPPSDLTRYWSVPAYKDHPIRGPQQAKGLVLWSHGLDGDRPQYQYAPPAIIRNFARAGWDVVKIQRNNLYEIRSAYDRHADHVVEQVVKARAEGYRHVVLAGQSYGGAISLEAGARTDRHFAVLAFAPGHGSDATQASHARRSDNLTDMLAEIAAKQRGPRVLVSIADGDVYHPHETRGPKIRAALAKQPGAYVLFDETMPIKGHGHADTNQYLAWFGRCILDFADPGREPRRPETVCPAPNPVPTFILPGNLKIEAPGSDVPALLARLGGSWSGKFGNARHIAQDQEVCVVFERLAADRAEIVYATGAGPGRQLNMGTGRFRVNWDGEKLTANSPDTLAIAMTPAADGGAIDLTVLSRNRENKFTARLTRGCP
jgi:dienelactone hydrolase